MDTENESLQEQVEDLKILIGSIVEERKQLKDQLTELQKRVDTMRAENQALKMKLNEIPSSVVFYFLIFSMNKNILNNTHRLMKKVYY